MTRANGCACLLAAIVAAAGCASGSAVTSQPFPYGSRAEGIPYSLPMTLVIAKLTVPAPKTPRAPMTLELTAQRVPDPSALLLLQVEESAFHDDDVGVKLSADGLLTGINVMSDDRTDDVVATTVRTAIRGALADAGGASRKVVPMEDSTVAPPEGIYTIVGPLQDENEARLPDGWRLVVAAKRLRPWTHATKEFLLTPTGKVDGVVVRGVETWIVEAELIRDAESSSTVVAHVELGVVAPDFMPYAVVPLDRATFVRADHSVVLEGGVLTSVGSNVPSSANAIVSLPYGLAEDVVQLPSNLLQLKFDIAQKQKQLANEERELLEALRKLEEERQKEPAELIGR